jgi:hypothetical protein
MEAEDVNEFEKQMQEAGEGGMKHIALAISVLAVLVAMVTVLGHRTHTEAVLQQTRAADQWNLYQAKKIREGQISVESDLLSLQPSSNDAGVQKKIADNKAHIEKWNDDLKEEQEKALDLEADVNRAEKRADRYDLGEALLQIAVVLSSITLLTRQQAYFILGLVIGLAGVLTAASAFLVH